MKIKLLLTTILFTLLLTPCHAHSPGLIFGVPLVQESSWTPLQISLWPIKLFDAKAVYGLNLSTNLFSYEKEIRGVSLNLITSATSDFYGVQCAPLCFSFGRTGGLSIGAINIGKQNQGVMIGAINCVSPRDDERKKEIFENFLQIGVINIAEEHLQIGVVNYNPNAWIPWMILFNYSNSKPEKNE